MRKMTKLTSMVVSIAMLSSISMIALANTDKDYTGSVYGYVYGNTSMKSATTSVDYNPGHGTLSTSMNVVNKMGETIWSSKNSFAEVTSMTIEMYAVPSDAYATYASGQVNGPGGSGAVYTYATINE